MTFVPPVTALRSPPLSRMTGADSPVMADSSTVAMPSTISPSAGIVSPASQTNRSPIFNSALGTRYFFAFDELAGHRLRAHLAQRVGVGFAAALRPSLRRSSRTGT